MLHTHKNKLALKDFRKLLTNETLNKYVIYIIMASKLEATKHTNDLLRIE